MFCIFFQALPVTCHQDLPQMSMLTCCYQAEQLTQFGIPPFCSLWIISVSVCTTVNFSPTCPEPSDPRQTKIT